MKSEPTYRRVRLGSVALINPRFSRPDMVADNTLVPFVSMAAIDEVAGSVATIEHRPLKSVTQGFTNFSSGDVLFAKITPCMQNGKSAIFHDEDVGIGFGSTEFFVIRPGKELLAGYLLHLVRQPEFRERAKARFTGAGGQQRVPRDFLENFELKLPSLEHQRHVSDILDSAERIRRLRREADTKLDALVAAQYIRMFGDPSDSSLALQTLPLAGLVDVLSGGTPSKARADYWSGDVPWVSPKDMKQSHLFGAQDHVSDLVFDETNLKLLPTHSVLIVVRGMILAHTVPVALSTVPVAINQDMKAFVVKPGLDAEYLLWTLRAFQPYLLAKVSTAAHGTKKIDMDVLASLPIPMPSLAEQLAFAEASRQIRNATSLATRSGEAIGDMIRSAVSLVFD